MKTHTITTYSYDELNEKAQARAREWSKKQSENDTYWHESTIDDAKECLGRAGFDIDNVWFRGFWSQGDGACFEGSWRAKDVNPAAVREYAPRDEKLHQIADECARIAGLFPYAFFFVKHSGHYSHEYCTEFDVHIVDENEDEIRTEEADKAEKALIEVSRSAMRWIYALLEDAHREEYGDENVAENIRINGYEFTEDGEFFEE